MLESEIKFMLDEYKGLDCPERSCIDRVLELEDEDRTKMVEYEMFLKEDEEKQKLVAQVAELKQAIADLEPHIRCNSGLEELYRLRLRGLIK